MTNIRDLTRFCSLLDEEGWRAMPYPVAMAIFSLWQKEFPGHTFGSPVMGEIFPESVETWPEGRKVDAAEEMMIVCTRVADLPGPHVDSRPVPCNGCGKLSWLARSTPIIPSAFIYCMQCVARRCIRSLQEMEARDGA